MNHKTQLRVPEREAASEWLRIEERERQSFGLSCCILDNLDRAVQQCYRYPFRNRKKGEQVTKSKKDIKMYKEIERKRKRVKQRQR